MGYLSGQEKGMIFTLLLIIVIVLVWYFANFLTNVICEWFNDKK